MFFTMVLANLDIWDMTNPSIKSANTMLQKSVLPALIFLLLLKCDMRKILKPGFRTLAIFLVAMLSVMVSVIIVYTIMHGFLPLVAWKGFSTLCGSWWLGGMVNMMAVKGAINVPGDIMGFMLITDSINYSAWLAIMLGIAALAPLFNKFTNTKQKIIEKLGGAFVLNAEDLQGEILINLDTEFDDEAVIGCAGGVDILAKIKLEKEEIPANHSFLKISLDNFYGGHSAIDIMKEEPMPSKKWLIFYILLIKLMIFHYAVLMEVN